MTLPSITSLVLVSDVLTETKMKPWWEVVRGKCVAVMFISALTMLTLSWTSTIHCLPTFSNMSLTNPDILYINGLCYDVLPIYSRHNLGIYAIAIALGIHIWYSWWLLVPSVKAKFHVVRNADDTLKKLTLIQHRIKELALCEPFDSRNTQQTNEIIAAEGSSEKIHISVRNVLRRLWPCRHPTRVMTLYFVRNIVGFLLLSGAILFSICSFKLIGQNSRYPCKVTVTVREVTFHDFTCSSELSHVPLLVLMSAYMISIIVQWLLTTIAPLFYKCFCNVNDWMLIKRFAASSTKLSGGTEKLLLDRDEVVGTMTDYLEKAARIGDFDYIDLYLKLGKSAKIIVNKQMRESFKRRIDNNEVKDDDLKTITQFCMKHKMYEEFVLAHYKWFGQNIDKDFDYDKCGCHENQDRFKEGLTDCLSRNSLLHCVLDSHNGIGETIFNPIVTEHFLYWIWKHRDNEERLQRPETECVRYQRGHPEKLELSFLLNKHRYGDDARFRNENHHYHNFYRAIRNGEEVTEEMKNFVFGGDKSFYKELSQFWLRNKLYREYVELHKLFYNFPGNRNHETIDCGCNEMIFHLADTEPGSKGRSLLYYVLVNLNPGSEAMRHVLRWGREKQDDSENRKVKVVIRGANYVDCSPVEYVNHPEINFNEPDRNRLIQTLKEFDYKA